MSHEQVGAARALPGVRVSRSPRIPWLDTPHLHVLRAEIQSPKS
jgi:hypothetical protein